jgi:Rad3-related DNA helicase
MLGLHSVQSRLLADVTSVASAQNFANLRHYRMVVRLLDAQPAENSNRRGRRHKNRQLCIWCLHASVGFSDISEQCHSVILASGTLSPLDSFAGELGADFPVRVEASHVIQPSQVRGEEWRMCATSASNVLHNLPDCLRL